MRNFTKAHKLQADSLVEIKRGLTRAAEAATDSGQRYGSRPVKPGNLLNGIVVWFLRLPIAEQERIARLGLAWLQELQDSDSATTIVASVEGVATAHGIGARVNRIHGVSLDSKSINRVADKTGKPKK